MTHTDGAAASPPVFRFLATYESPTNESFTFSESLAHPPTSLADDKAAYLNSMRKSIIAAQEIINKELTARMDEDRVKEAATCDGFAPKPIVDEALEENYGEEVHNDE